MGDWQAFLSSRKAKNETIRFWKGFWQPDCKRLFLIKEKREKQKKQKKKESNTQEMKTAQSFYNGHVGDSGDSLLRNGRPFSLTKILGIECWCKHNQTW